MVFKGTEFGNFLYSSRSKYRRTGLLGMDRWCMGTNLRTVQPTEPTERPPVRRPSKSKPRPKRTEKGDTSDTSDTNSWGLSLLPYSDPPFRLHSNSLPEPNKTQWTLHASPPGTAARRLALPTPSRASRSALSRQKSRTFLHQPWTARTIKRFSPWAVPKNGCYMMLSGVGTELGGVESLNERKFWAPRLPPFGFSSVSLPIFPSGWDGGWPILLSCPSHRKWGRDFGGGGYFGCHDRSYFGGARPVWPGVSIVQNGRFWAGQCPDRF